MLNQCNISVYKHDYNEYYMSQQSTTTYQLLGLQPSRSALVTIIVTVVIAVVAILRVVTKEQVLYIPGHANQSNISVYKLDHYKYNMSQKKYYYISVTSTSTITVSISNSSSYSCDSCSSNTTCANKRPVLFKSGHANH